MLGACTTAPSTPKWIYPTTTVNDVTPPGKLQKLTEITDFVEGKANGHYPAGTCYYMPADTQMSASNLGTEDAVLIDTFMLPYGVPPITILEPGYDVE